MDKNSYIGLGIIVVMLVVYLQFFSPSEPEEVATPETTEAVTDSVETPVADNIAVSSVSDTSPDSLKTQVASAPKGELLTIETDELIVKINTLGALIESVELKNYTTHTEEKLVLLDASNHNLEAKIGDLKINNLLFQASASGHKILKDGDTVSIVFTSDKAIITYEFYGSGFVLASDIKAKGSAVTFNWQNALKEVEHDSKMSMPRSGLHYYTSGEDFEDFGDGTGSEIETPEEKLRWVSSKQRFFSTAFISEENPFTDATLKSKTEGVAEGTFKQNNAEFSLPIKDGTASYRLYVGPNDYDILSDVTDGLNKNVYLGWTIFSYVNRFIVIPIFNLLEDVISNYGIVILLLVLIIKLGLFPIAYKSYLSMAKMKELKPEIDAIKARLGEENQTEVQQETMKLYNQVGVNPLAGCIPMLLQMPVLFALFNFFPNAIELRHKSFLWAHDLSTYDNLISWGDSIPLLGNHISIFTLLMTISTVLYTYYNNQINAQATGPMKYMGYAMPVVFFFVLNDYAAGLTFYYFVSNIITISQQLIATRFIDKDKIRKKLEENRKSAETGNKKTSKFQQRLQEAMKAQQATKGQKG